MHVHVFLGSKAGTKERDRETAVHTAPGGWLAADVACVADIGRSGGQQPVIMDGAMTLYYEQQLS